MPTDYQTESSLALKGTVVNAQHYREKAEVFQRLADGLSLNNLGRFQLMALAEDLEKRAKELETQTTPLQTQSENVK